MTLLEFRRLVTPLSIAVFPLRAALSGCVIKKLCAGVAQHALGGHRDQFDSLIERPAAGGVQRVERLEATEHPQQVNGLLDGTAARRNSRRLAAGLSRAKRRD
jgi:hypothetical protein